MAELTVRPAPNGIDHRSKYKFRAFVSPAFLVRFNLRDGCVYMLQSQGNDLGPTAIAKSPDKDLKASVIQMPQCLQMMYSLKLGDKVTINPTVVELQIATSISVVRSYKTSCKEGMEDTDDEDNIHWAWLLKLLFLQAEIVAPGKEYENVNALDQKRAYKIIEINSSRSCVLHRMHSKCQVYISDSQSSNDEISSNRSIVLTIPGSGLGGLDDQVKRLNQIVSEYNAAESRYEWLDGPPPRERGVLLFGFSGTGKSLLLQKIAEAGWKDVIKLNREAFEGPRMSEGSASIKKAFVDAVRSQPSVIIIDDLEYFAQKQSREDAAALRSFGALLCQEIDQLHDARVLVLGAAQSIADVDQDLRHLNRFSVEIEIPVPNSNARAEILRIICGRSIDAEDRELDSVAARTHGFVGRDLMRLHRLAGKEAIARVEGSQVDGTTASVAQDAQYQMKRLEVDYFNALQHVRPTAMREIFVETPQVRWTDIGGQEKVKEYLEEAIIWPFKSPNEMTRLGIHPTNGLLLYGPPGCSKTMTAKAVATESGLNFIAVKGAELLNMYVGESERAIRELFAKARAVSPSIIFFDEIDAIGASRDSGQHSGVHTVTTLLNELDGIDDAKGVFVLAATNRPEVLDPALTRPGRLDNMIYVGPPDKKARQHILQKRSESMDLDGTPDFALIADATDGRSGAEIVDICQRAGKMAYRDQMTTGQRQQVGEKHFVSALKDLPRNITPEMVESYRIFAANRR